MSVRQFVRGIGGSRAVGVLAARPRLVAFLLVTLVAVAMQGTVAAEDCTFCAGGSGEGDSNTGP
ncbi:MAG: hypothetical protein ABEI75_03525 [Halobaculum sp.]